MRTPKVEGGLLNKPNIDALIGQQLTTPFAVYDKKIYYH